MTVNGTFEPVMSSIENLFAPPLAESLAVSCQSLVGKPVPVAGVVELDPGVVLLQPDRVEAEALVVDAVEADAEAALDDRVVRDDVVLVLHGEPPRADRIPGRAVRAGRGLNGLGLDQRI